MKRTLAAALAAASIGGTMIAAIPASAFAASGVTLSVKPRAAHNGQSFAITAACADSSSYPVVYSNALRYIATDKNAGKPLNVQMYVRYGTRPGAYVVAAGCVEKNGSLSAHTWQYIWIHYAPGCGKPSPIPGFTPDVVVETGFGGMAKYVAEHHPAG
jgi:hypothetical protein